MACFFRGLAQENQQQYDAGRDVVCRRRPSTGTTPRIPSCIVPALFAARARPMRPRRSSPGWQKLSGSSGEYHFQQGCLLSGSPAR